MKITSILAAFIAITFAAISANAAGEHKFVPADINDPASLRINIMQNVGAATGAASAMLKGEVPFNAALANASLTTINTAALSLAGLFPVGSDTNARSAASPDIWTDTEKFSAAVAKFIADSAAARNANPQDIDSFREAFSTVAGNCKACHKSFKLRH